MIDSVACYRRECKHFLGTAGEESEGTLCAVCRAFPEPPGIPDEIAYGDNPHTDRYPGDGGIVFEKGKMCLRT
jgi:hypothetical protein